MDNLIGNLVEIIRREETLLKDFLDLLEHQKEFLVKNEIDQFEETVVQQEEMIEDIKNLESRRIELVRNIANGMKVEESEITMTRLIEMSLGQTSDELRKAKKSMAKLVNRIKRVNQVNQYLIKRTLNMVQRNIDWLIDGGQNLDATYEQNGRMRERESKAVVVNKTL